MTDDGAGDAAFEERMSFAVCSGSGSDIICCVAPAATRALRVCRVSTAGCSVDVTQELLSWCLPSPALHVTPVRWRGEPHVVVITADAHLWCLNVKLLDNNKLTAASHARRGAGDSAHAATVCAAKHANGTSAVGTALPPPVDSDSVSWPVAQVPLAHCACVAGEDVVVATAHGPPLVLSLPDIAATPRLGRLQLCTPVGVLHSQATCVTCLSCVQYPHEGTCIAAGWTQISAALARALLLPMSNGSSHDIHSSAAVGQRRPRAVMEADTVPGCTACSRWVLVGHADGRVCANVFADRNCIAPTVLFNMHQRCVHIAVVSENALLLVGAAGRAVIVRIDTQLLFQDLRLPCTAVSGACLLPNSNRVAVACDVGVLISSALLSKDDKEVEVHWSVSSLNGACDVSSATCGNSTHLLACTADGDVLLLPLPSETASTSCWAAVDGHLESGVEASSQRLASALSKLQVASSGRDAFSAEHAAADEALVELSGALTVAGAIAAAHGPHGVRVTLDARQTVANGAVCLVRAHACFAGPS